MRRFGFVLLSVLLLFSCATGGDAPEDDVDDTVVAIEDPEIPVVPEADGEEAVETDEDPADTTDEEPVVVEVEDPPPPQPALVIAEPADLSVLTTLEFILAVALDTEDERTPKSIEIEMVSGPVVSSRFVISDLSSLALSDRTWTIRLSDLSAAVGLGSGDDTASDTLPAADNLRAAVAVSLPAGLVDGALYSWRARGVLSDESLTTWTDEYNTRLNLGYASPVALSQRATIDSTPRLAWQTTEEFVLYRVTLLSSTGEILGDAVSANGTYEVPQPLASNHYRFAVSGLRTDGYVTGASDAATIRVLADATPSVAWPTGDELTLGARVGLHWTGVPGAGGYQARYRESDGEWVELPNTANLFTALPDALVPGGRYEWQVRAADENGKLFSWSTIASFEVDATDFDYVPVVRQGETAVLTRGYDAGSRDEGPVREVTLTLPFEMAVTPLSNADVARVVNYAIARGFVVADASGVYLPSPAGPESGDGSAGEPEATTDRTPLLGLDLMDYGHQLGLVFVDGVVAVRDGHADHPAVGITWAGGVQLANLLSFVEGRSPAYGPNGDSWDQESNGYRLPTEAEWEYAARGSTTRLLPWGSGLSGRAANYYRSFDPFEDVNEPFDAAGGPTTPSGFFSGGSQGGFQTTNGASPFGVVDMVGNVWEWCWDRYGPDYYAASDATDPSGPDASDLEVGNQPIVLAVTLDPNQRVVRGTAWNSRAPDVRLTNRGRYTELGTSYSIGVRLVRSPRE